MDGLSGPVAAHLALRQEHPDPSYSSTECSADSSSSERSTVSYRLRFRVTPAGQHVNLTDPEAKLLPLLSFNPAWLHQQALADFGDLPGSSARPQSCKMSWQ